MCEWMAERLEETKLRIPTFNQPAVEEFSDHSAFGLFMLKFPLLDCVAESLTRFGPVPIFSASPTEHFNYHMKDGCRKTSQWYSYALDDIVRAMEHG